MEINLVGKPELKEPKTCCICGTETDFMAAHKPGCKVDAGCDCNMTVCSKTACEVRGKGRQIFGRTKINPRRNPMEIEELEDDDDDEEVIVATNPHHDHDDDDDDDDVWVADDDDNLCVECDEVEIACDDCDCCSGCCSCKPAKKARKNPTCSSYDCSSTEIYDKDTFGAPLCVDCYYEAMEEAGQYEGARNNPAESKLKKTAKTAGLLGVGAILGWFMKDRLD